MQKVKNVAFTINGHEISFPFWQMVLNLCRGDRFLAARVFFRAHRAGARNPIAWIRAGFRLPVRYALKPCMEEEQGGTAVQTWIDNNIFSKNCIGMISLKRALWDFITETDHREELFSKTEIFPTR